MNISCVICMDMFDGQNVVATPCGHIFHSKCINKWFDNQKACPECRCRVPKQSIIKLYLNVSPNDSFRFNAEVQNDIDSKVAEIKAKEAEISKLNKKVKELQTHSASIEQLYQNTYQKYLATQHELDSAKGMLKTIQKLEARIGKLIQENTRLESQLTQFSNIQTILEGSQQDAERDLDEQESLLRQEVGGEVAKNMRTLCSILKRELLQVWAQKDQHKKKEDDLLYKLGLKNAKLNRVLQSEASLKEQLKKAVASPRPVPSIEHALSSTPDGPALNTPVNHGDGVQQASTSKSDLTPILINFSNKKRPNLKKVVIDGSSQGLSEVTPVAVPLRLQQVKSFKRPVLENDPDSITRVGYNGLGGHEYVLFKSGRENMLKKPYKRNPNVKKGK